MSRKTAREVAMKIAFANLLGGDAQYIDAFSDLSSDSDFINPPTEEDILFAESLKNGINEHTEKLDETICSYLRGWDIDRLPKIDLTILRLAVYELSYEPDVPKKAIINEAVRLAQKFGTKSSSSYINGVLGSYVRDMERNTEGCAEEASEKASETGVFEADTDKDSRFKPETES